MKILIVEDDKNSRLYLENLLKINNYKYRSAVNGLAGLDMFEKYKPDVVISDIQMPIMDGLELLEAIRDKKSDAIVVITTAYGTENYAIQALHLGANNYLKKPVRSYDLIPLLKKYEAVLKSKFTGEKLPGKMIFRKYRMEFLTSIELIPMIVDRLIIEAYCELPNNDRINVELGLVEMITNAVEHGNLEITYHEKQDALNKNTFSHLYNKKLNNPKYKNKKIYIDFKADNKGYEWKITDEGKGFNWNNLPDPTNNNNILKLNGRGIFITKFLFDELEYSGKGNIVRVKKYFHKKSK